MSTGAIGTPTLGRAIDPRVLQLVNEASAPLQTLFSQLVKQVLSQQTQIGVLESKVGSLQQECLEAHNPANTTVSRAFVEQLGGQLQQTQEQLKDSRDRVAELRREVATLRAEAAQPLPQPPLLSNKANVPSEILNVQIETLSKQLTDWSVLNQQIVGERKSMASAIDQLLREKAQLQTLLQQGEKRTTELLTQHNASALAQRVAADQKWAIDIQKQLSTQHDRIVGDWRSTQVDIMNVLREIRQGQETTKLLERWEKVQQALTRFDARLSQIDLPIQGKLDKLTSGLSEVQQNTKQALALQAKNQSEWTAAFDTKCGQPLANQKAWMDAHSRLETFLTESAAPEVLKQQMHGMSGIWLSITRILADLSQLVLSTADQKSGTSPLFTRLKSSDVYIKLYNQLHEKLREDTAISKWTTAELAALGLCEFPTAPRTNEAIVDDIIKQIRVLLFWNDERRIQFEDYHQAVAVLLGDQAYSDRVLKSGDTVLESEVERFILAAIIPSSVDGKYDPITKLDDVKCAADPVVTPTPKPLSSGGKHHQHHHHHHHRHRRPRDGGHRHRTLRPHHTHAFYRRPSGYDLFANSNARQQK